MRVRKLASTVYGNGATNLDSHGSYPSVDSGAWRLLCSLKNVSKRDGGIHLARQMVSQGGADLSFSCGVQASARTVRSHVKRDMTVDVHVIRALGTTHPIWIVTHPCSETL